MEAIGEFLQKNSSHSISKNETDIATKQIYTQFDTLHLVWVYGQSHPRARRRNARDQHDQNSGQEENN